GGHLDHDEWREPDEIRRSRLLGADRVLEERASRPLMTEDGGQRRADALLVGQRHGARRTDEREYRLQRRGNRTGKGRERRDTRCPVGARGAGRALRPLRSDRADGPLRTRLTLRAGLTLRSSGPRGAGHTLQPLRTSGPDLTLRSLRSLRPDVSARSTRADRANRDVNPHRAPGRHGIADARDGQTIGAGREYRHE